MGLAGLEPWCTAAAIHVLIALAIQYGWSHEQAVTATARQAAEIYGFEWRGSIYVSYAFVLIWLAEAWRWRRNPALYVARVSAATWVLRLFFLLVIVNGAIVFATHPMRLLGLAIVGVLVWSWFPIARPGHIGRRRLDRA